MLGKAYDQAFTPKNIKKGFEVTGIWPFNRFVFSEKEFASSAVTDRPAPPEIATVATSSSEPTPSSPGIKKKFQPLFSFVFVPFFHLFFSHFSLVFKTCPESYSTFAFG